MTKTTKTTKLTKAQATTLRAVLASGGITNENLHGNYGQMVRRLHAAALLERVRTVDGIRYFATAKACLALASEVR